MHNYTFVFNNIKILKKKKMELESPSNIYTLS